jgi:hypothetical protein
VCGDIIRDRPQRSDEDRSAAPDERLGPASETTGSPFLLRGTAYVEHDERPASAQVSFSVTGDVIVPESSAIGEQEASRVAVSTKVPEAKMTCRLVEQAIHLRAIDPGWAQVLDAYAGQQPTQALAFGCQGSGGLLSVKKADLHERHRGDLNVAGDAELSSQPARQIEAQAPGFLV